MHSITSAKYSMNVSGATPSVQPIFYAAEPSPNKSCKSARTISYRHIDTGKKFIVNGLLQFMGEAKNPGTVGTAKDADAFFRVYNRVMGPILIDRSVDMPKGPAMGKAKDAYKTNKLALLKSYKKGYTSREHAIPKSVLVGPCPEGYVGKKLAVKGEIENLAFVYEENSAVHRAHTSTRVYSANGTIINAGEDMETEAERTLHEVRRIQHRESMRYLLTKEKSVSAALQLQQLEYRHSARSQLSRNSRSGTPDWLANKIADESFYENLKQIRDIYFAPDDFWQTEGDVVEIHSLEVTDTDRIEAAIARFHVQQNGARTTVADVKRMLISEAFHVPASIASLRGSPTEADEQTLFWSTPDSTLPGGKVRNPT